MITAFEASSRFSSAPELAGYIRELCEKLNLSFSYVESQLGEAVSEIKRGAGRSDSVLVNGGEAQISSDGELICNLVKTKKLSAEKAELSQLSASKRVQLPNGAAVTDTEGAQLTSLWHAESAAGYKGTGDTLTNIEGIGKFRVYFVKFCGVNNATEGDILIPCMRVGDYIRGTGGYALDANMYLFSLNVHMSGHNLSILASKVYNPQNGNYNDRKICRIYGVI